MSVTEAGKFFVSYIVTRLMELRVVVCNLCQRVVAAYFWVGKRGSANPTPDANGRAVPDRSHRYVSDVGPRFVFYL